MEINIQQRFILSSLNLILLMGSSGLMYASSWVDVHEDPPKKVTYSSLKNNADAPEEDYYFDGPSRVVTLSVGPAWSSPGTTQTFFLQSNVQKSYVTTNGASAIADGELFYGFERPLRSQMRAQLGVAVAGATNIGLYGDILEDADPDFNNYFYKYNVNHAHVGFKAKLIKELKSKYEPYVSSSVALGFNHAYNFSITPKISQEVPAPYFQSNTALVVTYTLGAGIQKRVDNNWLIGLGYEYADWGSSNLSAAPGQSLGGGLYMNHIYTNQAQLSITYQPKLPQVEGK